MSVRLKMYIHFPYLCSDLYIVFHNNYSLPFAKTVIGYILTYEYHLDLGFHYQCLTILTNGYIPLPVPSVSTRRQNES